MSLHAPQAGEMLAGKYRIERVLGEGGMGVVVAATHLQLNQRVAVKLMRKEAINEEALERFLREARALVRLRSERVARVLDVGETADGTPFMVMEYLEGSDLSGVLQQRGVLAVKDAVEYLLQACEALAEAHAAGIIHRDLKPANLFLTRAPDGGDAIKVLDFGIAKSLDAEEGPQKKNLTATTTVFGSPAYMSPEQMRSARNADARSDIWSLGVILYELLAGEPPFDGETYPDLVLAVNMAKPVALARRRHDVPAGLEAAALRCVEKQPEKRFASVADFAEAIAPFGHPEAAAAARRIARTMSSSGSIRRTGPGAAEIDPSSSAATSITSVAEAGATRPASRGLLVAVAVAVVSLAGALIAIVALARSGGAASSGPTTAHPDGPTPITATATALPAGSARLGLGLGLDLDPVPEVAVSAALPPLGATPPASAAPTATTAPRATAATRIPTATPAPPAVTATPPKKSPLDVTIK